MRAPGPFGPAPASYVPGVSTLYLVSTPIGHLGDITLRAVEVLGSVDRILVEDTRRTRVLLDHLNLRTPMVSLHAHNEAERIGSVLGWLGAGESLALVSDAGTPLMSDPGERLVPAVVEAGHAVVPIPGPSAILAALVASGLPTVPFRFLGFPPRKGKERSSFLAQVAESPDTVVLFESPERLRALLEALQEGCGPERRVAVARELTKLHEEVTRGTLAEVGAYYSQGRIRGEVCVVVGGAPPSRSEPGADEETGRILARSLLEQGMSPSRVAREVGRIVGLPRSLAYRIVHTLPGIEGGEEAP
jgi:16S rRNA (cytidine1402-2'-O)-methyltransferase